MSNEECSPSKSKLTKRDSYTEAALFDPLALAYDDWFEQEGKLIFAIEVQAFQESLTSLRRPWLEVGVGSGRFAHTLGIEIGIDPSIRLLEMASKRGIAVFLGKGEQQPFDAGAFGTVFLIVTLCFVDSPSDVLNEASRVLVPDGKIALGLVLKESPWGKFYEQKKRQGHRFYKYATFYTYNEVIRLLEQAGFSIENAISTLFQKPHKVKRIELPRQGYSSSAGFTIMIAGKRW